MSMKSRNKFNMSRQNPFTGDMGEFIPFNVLEVNPGDSFQHSSSILLRCMPLNAPVMHPTHVFIKSYFIPNRLVWKDWEDFITGGKDGTSAPLFPTIVAPAVGGWPVGSLADYLGYPTGVPNFVCDARPFRAYALVWNEFIRDQNLQDELPISLDSGVDVITSTLLQNVCWSKDYLTTARPFEQLGSQVLLPLVGEAPVKGLAISNAETYTGAAGIFRESGTAGVPAGNNWSTGASASTRVQGNNTTKVPNIHVDGSDFVSPSVNELRFSMAWQRVLEGMARFGHRYVDLLARWGVKSSDARLQRPEYLGGGVETIQFSEILATANNEDTVLGELGGHGISAMKSNSFNYFAEEHGFIITLVFVRPIAYYPQGCPKMYLRRTREDFWMPELQHIGQQEVLNAEVYAAHPDPLGRFGFQDRYDDLRHQVGSVAGDFKPGQDLDFFTMARAFATPPALNADFVKCVPTKDIFKVPSRDGLLFMPHHRVVKRSLLARIGSSFIR